MASIIKVDDVQDAAGNNIIREAGDTITIGASGDTITIPSGATITNSGTATGFGGANTPAFRVHLNADQAVSSSSYTKVAFDVEDYDTNSAVSSGTFTVPSGKAGIYQISSAYMCRSASNNVTVGSINIYKNGSQFVNQFFNFNTSQDIRDHFVDINTALELAEADTIEIYTYIVATSPIVSVSVNGAFFNMYKIIE